MVKLHESYVAELGFELAIPGSAVKCATDHAVTPSTDNGGQRKGAHRCVEYELITKTYLYNFDPLKPHFYIVKLGFTGVYIIFLISAQNIDYGYSLEPPRRGGSNEYPQSMF